jgi:hypothetical protein
MHHVSGFTFMITFTLASNLFRFNASSAASGASWGKTIAVALRRHYESDRRIIPLAEQNRIAREYCARCAEEDARRLPT